MFENEVLLYIEIVQFPFGLLNSPDHPEILETFGPPPTPETASAAQYPVKVPDPVPSENTPEELTSVLENNVVTAEVCVPRWLIRLSMFPLGAFIFIT
jgi:hypothetical protein